MGLQTPGSKFFLAPGQIFQMVGCPLRGRLGCILGAVILSVLPAPTLGYVPELALQLFCSGEKAAPEQLLRGGLNPFFCAS